MIDMEEVVLDSSGARKWLSISEVAVRNERNEIIGLVGVSRDVTARKQAELLREEQALVLEMIAMNALRAEVFDRLVRRMETQLDGRPKLNRPCENSDPSSPKPQQGRVADAHANNKRSHEFHIRSAEWRNTTKSR